MREAICSAKAKGSNYLLTSKQLPPFDFARRHCPRSQTGRLGGDFPAAARRDEDRPYRVIERAAGISRLVVSVAGSSRGLHHSYSVLML